MGKRGPQSLGLCGRGCLGGIWGCDDMDTPDQKGQ